VSKSVLQVKRVSSIMQLCLCSH